MAQFWLGELCYLNPGAILKPTTPTVSVIAVISPAVKDEFPLPSNLLAI
jgi:hypothetical protein